VAEVLYRRWRPRRFADVAGQETVVNTLRQAVAQNRLAHAYLFCGPRGTGKTSNARILAKAVNCLSPKDGEPDSACAICTAIDEGRALDLIEIDAASHRGVDDARSLRERVFGSGPAEARYKVYIIDEVHMLSNDAFNTLLKTLEEPPPWAIFILCTTEAQKIPATIVSRCQRYDFRRITPADTVRRLEVICKGEGYACQADALGAIARAASGSLRDACNLLEQVAGANERQVNMAGVEDLLGLRGSEHALPLVRAVLTRQVPEALNVLAAAAANGVDLRVLHRFVLEYLRAALLLRSGVSEGVDLPQDAAAALRELSSKAATDHIVRAIKSFSQANLRASEGVLSLPLELAVMESCVEFAPAPAVQPDASRAATPRGAAQQPPAAARPSAPRSGVGAPNSAPAPRPAAPQPYRPPQAAPTTTAAPPPQQGQPAARIGAPRPAAPRAPASPEWDALYRALRNTRGKSFTIGALLNDCAEHRVENGALVLVFRHASNMERLQRELEDPQARAAVQKAVRDAFSADYDLKLVASGNGSAADKPEGYLVNTARGILGMKARIIEETDYNEEDPA
jgi:DNA polymerase-3 subunit gamma/tau